MASDVDKAALQKILDSGDTEACLAFFHGMPEKLRREYFPVVKTFSSQVRKNRFIEDPPGTFRGNHLLSIAETAFFATATGAEIIKAKRSGYPNAERAFAILEDRRPNWVDEWIQTLLGESWYWQHWRLIRRLMAAGLARKPDSPRYYLGMISSLNRRMNKQSLADALKEAPDLLSEDVWKLFEYDGDAENSLANTERFERSWIEAFLTLMSEGKLSRTRLLESSIDALERDFNHYRAKWFFELFDRLEPTDDELRGFGERLLGLLGVSAPNVQSWALKRIEAMARSGNFDSQTLCHGVEPILRARAKGTVITALSLLECQAATDPRDSARIASTVVRALAHESADVQKAAFRLLDSLANPDDISVCHAVRNLQSSLSASVRKLAAKWLTEDPESKGTKRKLTGTAEASTNNGRSGSTAAGKSDSQPKISPELESLYSIDRLKRNQQDGRLEIPAAIFDGTELPRLALVKPVKPIADIDELIDTCARVIEDSSLVDEAERCIDALTRLCESKPEDHASLFAPLLKRIRQRISKGASPFCGTDPANDVMGLVYAFCTGKVIEPVANSDQLNFQFEGAAYREFLVNTKKPIGFLSMRCLNAAKRIAAGGGCQLLSAPTHEGGWIDARVLADRVNGWIGADPDAHDVILAMLRLAPERRDSARAVLKESQEEWVHAIRYALGDDAVSIGDTVGLWAAAARARRPWHDDAKVKQKFPDSGPDAAEAVTPKLWSRMWKSGAYTFYDAGFCVKADATQAVDPLLVTVLFHATSSHEVECSFEMGRFAGRTNGAVRWTATIWPIARESYFAASADVCFNNIDWVEAQWQNRTMLEPLIDSATPLRTTGLLFLVGMLAAKEPGESGLATDIAIRAIEDGRLGSDNLGEALNTLLQTGIIKPGRWQKALSEVARTSRGHASVVQLALQNCFCDETVSLPKDTSKLLELLLELSVELDVSITSPSCRKWLSNGKVTGKTAKLAKELLALGTVERELVEELLNEAIELRTSAASRMIEG